MKSKQYYVRLFAIILVAVFGIISCATPTGTPDQKARQTEANAQVAQNVALGIGATLLGAAANRYVNNHTYYRPYYRPYYRNYYVRPVYPVYY